MKSSALAEVLERVEAWPADAQERLAEIAREIDAGLAGVVYEPTDDELAGIDRGLRDAEQGRFATDDQVEAVLAKLRGA
jgi:predicted transcriptional regulator